MGGPRIVTAVQLVVPDGRDADLVAGYRELVAGPRPEGLLRSELLRGQGGRWLVQSVWRDRDAALAARVPGQQPPVLALAEHVGAEHSHDVWTLEHSLGE